MRTPIRTLVFAALYSLSQVSGASALDAPPYVLQWGSMGTGTGQFKRPGSIDVGPTGLVYVCDIFMYRVQVFSSTGTFVTQFGSQGFSAGKFADAVAAVAVSPTGEVYAADINRIQKFTSAGAFISAWGSSGRTPGKFSRPSGITIDSAGYVYVADGGDRIQKFDSVGNFIMQWGTHGTGPGQFNYPYGIAIDPAGNVFVGDVGNYRIQMFRSDTTFVRSWSGTLADSTDLYPISIDVDRYGHIYSPNYGRHNVSIWDTTGTYWYRWGGLGSGPGQFNGPIGIAFDNSGGIFVTDGDNQRVQKFAENGVVGSGDAVPNGVFEVHVVGSPTANGRLSIQFFGRAGAAVSGDIFSIGGRLLEGIQGTTDSAGRLTIHWTPRKDLGPGVYFLKARQGKMVSNSRFVVLR